MKKIMITVTLSLLAFSSFAKNNFFAHPKEPSGQLILVPNKTTKALFPVTLLSINGKEVAHKDNAVWLKPGSYQLSFSAKVNHSYAGGNGINISRSNNRNGKLNNDLSITVEDNKIYYIAFDAHDVDQKNWQPVVWMEK